MSEITRFQMYLDRYLERYLGGHISLFGHRVTIYGYNAMHFAINIRTKRWGTICFHPTAWCFGRWWPWYFYLSPNSTPWAATFAIGPGVGKMQKRMAALRRIYLGHGYRTHDHKEEMDAIADFEDRMGAIRVRDAIREREARYISRGNAS